VSFHVASFLRTSVVRRPRWSLDGYGVRRAGLDPRRRRRLPAASVGDGVAAFQDFQRTPFLELQREALPSFALDAKHALDADAKFGGALFRAAGGTQQCSREKSKEAMRR